MLFSVLYGFWVANYIAFNGDVMRELAAQFLSLAQKQAATVPLMIGHRLMGISLQCTGAITEGRTRYNQAFALYDPVKHRSLATRFGQDAGVAILSYRSIASWMLGYPKAALADAEQALTDAREISHAPTVMFALLHTSFTHLLCGNLESASTLLDKAATLADEKAASYWKIAEMIFRGGYWPSPTKLWTQFK